MPRALVTLAETVIQAHEPERFALLYRLIWRMHARRATPARTDHRSRGPSRAAARAVGAARYPQDAGIRALPRGRGGRRRRATSPGSSLRTTSSRRTRPFFVRRFATMTWSILTPYRSAHWNGVELTFGPGAEPGRRAGRRSRSRQYWRTYFSSIFNPARLKVGAMQAEMPRKYWKNLPEAAAIPELIRAAQGRVDSMVEQPVISPPRPTKRFAAQAVPDRSRTTRSPRRRPTLRNAAGATFGSTRRRPCSGRDRRTRP